MAGGAPGTQGFPWSVSYATWEQLAGDAGVRQTRRLASVPSRFLGSIYSALSLG